LEFKKTAKQDYFHRIRSFKKPAPSDHNLLPPLFAISIMPIPIRGFMDYFDVLELAGAADLLGESKKGKFL